MAVVYALLVNFALFFPSSKKRTDRKPIFGRVLKHFKITTNDKSTIAVTNFVSDMRKVRLMDQLALFFPTLNMWIWGAM